MLSLDQVLRLISLPAVVVAFLIASHVSAALNHSPAPAQVAANNPAN
jgi:hypothetical protein